MNKELHALRINFLALKQAGSLAQFIQEVAEGPFEKQTG